MTELEAIRARHAVRNYTKKPLSKSIIDGLKEEIEQCNQLGQLHIQLVTENDDAFKNFIPVFGRFKNVKNYIALVAKKKGDFYAKSGYYGARLMIKAQQAGLNSCWVMNTYNARKCSVSLAPDEELVSVIAIGYGTTVGTQHKSKSIESLCKLCSDKWFINGMNVAVLAPTGLNKQNFYIETKGNAVSISTKSNSPMSKIDTGIVKYHFEIGAGKENFNWQLLKQMEQ